MSAATATGSAAATAFSAVAGAKVTDRHVDLVWTLVVEAVPNVHVARVATPVLVERVYWQAWNGVGLATDVLDTAVNLSVNSLAKTDVVMTATRIALATAVAWSCVIGSGMLFSDVPFGKVFRVGDGLWNHGFGLVGSFIHLRHRQLRKRQWLIGGHLSRWRQIEAILRLHWGGLRFVFEIDVGQQRAEIIISMSGWAGSQQRHCCQCQGKEA